MQVKHHMYLNSVGIPESEPANCEFSEKKSYIKK